MVDLVLHPVTRRAVDEFVGRPAHALMITGMAGSGKSSVAAQVVADVLKFDVAQYHTQPYVRTIRSVDNKAIPIEAVREVQKFLSLRVPGSRSLARAIVIEDAHFLTPEAQNALLKMLEEPPADTIVVLTTQSTESVLPTIQSRVRQLAVLPPKPDELKEYFIKQGYTPELAGRAMMLSGELPGLAASLLAQDDSHPLVEATTHARGILQSKSYERLLLVDSLTKQKQLCQDTLFVLGQMARMALARTTDPKAAQRWQRILRATYDATEHLNHNAQTKLVLTALMFEL